MENNKRYEFGGFTFGSAGLFQLTIKTINPSNFGTSNTIELGIELNADERLQLLKLLIKANESEGI